MKPPPLGFSAVRNLQFKNTDKAKPDDALVSAAFSIELHKQLNQQQVITANLNEAFFPDRPPDNWLLLTGPTCDEFRKELEQLPPGEIDSDGMWHLLRKFIKHDKRPTAFVVEYQSEPLATKAPTVSSPQPTAQPDPSKISTPFLFSNLPLLLKELGE